MPHRQTRFAVAGVGSIMAMLGGPIATSPSPWMSSIGLATSVCGLVTAVTALVSKFYRDRSVAARKVDFDELRGEIRQDLKTLEQLLVSLHLQANPPNPPKELDRGRTNPLH